MKMTPAAWAKTIGAGIGALVTAAAAGHAAGRVAAERAYGSDEPPTISAPATTSADIAALRKHIDSRIDTLQDRFDKRIDALGERVDQLRDHSR